MGIGKPPIVLSEFYGDPTHLIYFQTRPDSYACLLAAVRETLVARGTLMPFIPEDVFGRHEFLGGVHALRGLTPSERKRYFKSLTAFSDDEEDGEEDDVLDDDQDLEVDAVFLYAADLFRFFEHRHAHTDASDEKHLRLLKNFFRLAFRKGDLNEVERGSEKNGPLEYVFRTGGQREQPPIGQSIFFHEKKTLGNQEAS